MASSFATSGRTVVGELEAQETAEEQGWTYVSPYSDAKIIGGQGTIALEIERQGDPVDTIFVPVGGGGLIVGIAGYLKARDASIHVVGCQPENSCVMAESVKAGKILELDSEPTLADGVAGGLDPDAITFPVCRRVVDEFTLLSEDAIAEAMRFMIEKHHTLIEGAAALSIAAYLEDPTRYRDQTVVLVVSGKKVSLDTLTKVLSKCGSPHESRKSPYESRR